jgi:hypothetical protein
MNWLFNNPLIFVLYFIAVWVLVSYVIGLLSGWVFLSRRFPDSGVFYSYQWPFQSVRMRNLWGTYSNCANFGADEAGLYMAVFPIFSIGHPPLFIPWSEIQVVSSTEVLYSRNENYSWDATSWFLSSLLCHWPKN